MDSAEQIAMSHKFEPSISIKYCNARRINVYGSDGRLADGSREVTLTLNRHFDQLAVNTSLSSVLMPADVADTDAAVKNAIEWSGYLDPLFENNYETDPSLSWQYFGSSSGFLRRYPAIKWPPDELSARSHQDMFDFRSSSWYIDASTSPKDIVILLDSSGSMTGERREIAKSVVEAILDTLGNNDFVTVFKFSDQTEELVPCFKDMLVQANMENIRELKNALDSTKSENIANFSSALITAFEILQKYNKTGQGSQCNQAIMLLTDGPPYSYTDIFKLYNWPHMPVRVFTYLIGRDSRNAQEMNVMACDNKGYYVRVSSEGEAREKVLKYVSVMARPMVMYQNDHPIQWTPVYTGGKVTTTLVNFTLPLPPWGSRASNIQSESDTDGQLMTSVSTPIFDRRNYTRRVANLLGVVGTDVPIQQIKKLVPPYKLGVNGYSFIITNNGHVLYHPDLRPLMRHDMIDQKEGETEISVKIHYDDMKRVTTRRYKYFYNPIDGTPFSLGLAIPDGYGMYEVLAEQEIKHSPINAELFQHSTLALEVRGVTLAIDQTADDGKTWGSSPVTEYFKGSNWKVHPDWVYCEYNYASEHRFKSPEEQVFHFLAKIRNPGWKWMSLRPRSPLKDTPHSTMKKMEKDSYFCDKTLMQSLVLDAYATDGMERHNMPSMLKEDKKHFSESNRRAIDEVWYKRAVDHYSIEPDSFVFSVPFDAGAHGKPLVTATHAVFVDHKGHRAPAAVVGLQFQHSTLAAHFLNITSTCSGCKKTCASEELDCYVLDNNGFIILSESAEHTGRFFGHIDGTIMDSLVQDRIYKKVAVFDYQGACSDTKSHYSDAASTLDPTVPVRWFLQWLFGHFLWLAVQTNLYQLWAPEWASANEDDQPLSAVGPGVGISQLGWYVSHQTLSISAVGPGVGISQLGRYVSHQTNLYELWALEWAAAKQDGMYHIKPTSINCGPWSGYQPNRTVCIASHQPLSAVGPGVGISQTGRYVSHQTNLYHLWALEWASTYEDGPLYPDDYETLHVNFDQYPTREEGRMFPNSDVVVGGPDPPQPRPYPSPASSPVGYNRTHPRPCDKKVDLYILQPERLNTSGQSNPLKGKLTNCHVTGCERPFSVQKIPCSNLILLVVDTLCPCGSKQLSITPQEVNYESVSPGGSMVQCRTKPQETMYRRRPPKCMNYHPEESEIGLCGGCSISLSSLRILALCLLVWTLSTVNCSSS
uniref:VWFA domain-containing protein n=1 Tax=Timema genevievae TaxID=629358 RepID=A0A7R9PIE2_TIMGE|nr:unnamed protein product [Timema genevievae]